MPVKRWINRPRIESFDYTGNHAYHVTLVTRGREPVLRDGVATSVERALCEIAATIDALWQPSFHDHVLRKDEDLHVVARYIFANPVEAGFATDAGDWERSGGTLFETLRGTR